MNYIDFFIRMLFHYSVKTYNHTKANSKHFLTTTLKSTIYLNLGKFSKVNIKHYVTTSHFYGIFTKNTRLRFCGKKL